MRLHHVIESENGDSTILQRPADGVADDCGPQMAHMHFLGNIGRGKVNNGTLVP